MAKQRVQQAAAKQAAAMKAMRFTGMSRMAAALQHEFKLQSAFKLGYRNKEDVSNLPPYVLVVGSQNVLTNAAEQVAARTGYTLDGPTGDQNTYGIDSAYDFNNRVTGIQNLRKWGPNLEVRHVNPTTDAVTWVNILSTLTATQVANFTDYWNTTELKNMCLFVNGASQPVYEWTGALGSYASSTSTTITVQGTTSLSGLNFYNSSSDAGKFQLLINGNTYFYTAAGNATATPFNQTPTNNNITINNTNWSSQLFTTGASAVSLTSLVLAWNANAAQAFPAVFIADIYTDNAGVPGTLVGSAQYSTASIGAGGDASASFTFNQLFVSPATNYHLVIHAQQGDSNLRVKTGNTPAVGTNVSTNTGSTWAAQNGYMNAVITENDTNTTTFTGVTPDPTSAGIAVGDAIIQKPVVGVVIPTGVPSTFTTDLISTMGNQVYYGSFKDHTVYISAVNNYGSCTFSTPRVVGEGASATLDATPVGFAPQDDSMLVSAGMDYWYQSKFTLSADLADESFQFGRLKTTPNQGAQSQALINKMKNNIIFVSYEPIFNTLGTSKDFLNSPQTTNLSDPIKYDMDAYDFTGGSSYYFNYFLYFTVPTMGVVRLYNVQKKYWEAPQTLPVGRFYQVDGQLYGHSYLTNESYQVFVPGVYSDNGNPINSVAAFPYVSSEGAQPNQQKFFNRLYTEGYISGNAKLNVSINYDFGAFSGTYATTISGADPRIIFNKITDGSLGQDTLGTQPIGTILNLSQTPVIPKFRVINTFTPTNAYEYQIVYSSYDVDYNWALLRFGPAIGPARDMPTSISE